MLLTKICSIHSLTHCDSLSQSILSLSDSREVKPKIVFGFRMLKPVSLVRS